MSTFSQRFEGDPYDKFAPSPNVEDRTGEGAAKGYLGGVMAEVLRRRLLLEELREKMMSASAHAEGPRVDRLGVGSDNPLARGLGTVDIDNAMIRQQNGYKPFPDRRDPAEIIVDDTINGGES